MIIWNGVLYTDEKVDFIPHEPLVDFIYQNHQAWYYDSHTQHLVCYWMILE